MTGTFSDAPQRCCDDSLGFAENVDVVEEILEISRNHLSETKSSLLSEAALFNLAATWQQISLQDRSVFFDFPGTVGGNTWRSAFSKSRAIALLNNLYKEEGNIWMKTVSACRKTSFY